MKYDIYLPLDEMGAKKINFDVAADYLEIKSVFSENSVSFTKDLVNTSEIGAERDYADVDEEMTNREEIVSGAVLKISERRNALECEYPFQLDQNGDMLTYVGQEPSYGQAAYVISLILSNLKSMSPILGRSSIHPQDREVRDMREYFQYFATAAMAAEVNGHAWSFGFPRLDGTGFHTKLDEIWKVIRDGDLGPAAKGVPAAPKDDQIDVFAARPHRDGLPGFLFAAAQVATGKNWRDKSLRNHLDRVFLVAGLGNSQ